MKYSKGYEYQVKETETTRLSARPTRDVENRFLSLTTNGVLIIAEGYAWDGPSGPAWHTKTFMRGSLIHDALYQLIRENPTILPISIWRKIADQELRRVCLEDGMIRARAWWVYRAVRRFGRGAAKTSRIRKVLQAPKNRLSKSVDPGE